MHDDAIGRRFSLEENNAIRALESIRVFHALKSCPVIHGFTAVICH